MKIRRCTLAIAALALSCVAASPAPIAAQNAAATHEDPRTENFLPLGVYWAGEQTFREIRDTKARWRKIDAALDDLAAHHVNSVWLTHLSAAETAEFSRHAQRRGIYLVASPAEIAGDVQVVRRGDHKQLIKNTLHDWGDAPKPIAWGLGDEPKTAYMAEMTTYVRDWHEQAPGEPLTTVVMWHDLDAGGKAGFDALSCDVYPFFSRNNPDGYGMPPHAA